MKCWNGSSPCVWKCRGWKANRGFWSKQRGSSRDKSYHSTSSAEGKLTACLSPAWPKAGRLLKVEKEDLNCPRKKSNDVAIFVMNRWYLNKGNFFRETSEEFWVLSKKEFIWIKASSLVKQTWVGKRIPLLLQESRRGIKSFIKIQRCDPRRRGQIFLHWWWWRWRRWWCIV